MKIHDPGADNKSGLLVPVWDFFGLKERMDIYGGEENYTRSTDPADSFLTINAVDGTIIDRGLGY